MCCMYDHSLTMFDAQAKMQSGVVALPPLAVECPAVELQTVLQKAAVRRKS